MSNGLVNIGLTAGNVDQNLKNLRGIREYAVMDACMIILTG